MLADTMLMTAQAMQEDRIRRVAADTLIADARAERDTRVPVRVRCGALLVSLGARMMGTKAAPASPWRTINVAR
jgi:hypothetical protein